MSTEMTYHEVLDLGKRLNAEVNERLAIVGVDTTDIDEETYTNLRLRLIRSALRLYALNQENPPACCLEPEIPVGDDEQWLRLG